jgi:hypothetical protein
LAAVFCRLVGTEEFRVVVSFHDIFIIWTGILEKLHQFLDDLNMIYPTIKFTMNHTKKENENICECPPCDSIPFWTPQLMSKRTKLYWIYTRIQRQYLLTSSCHPAHVTQDIPFLLACRIVRIFLKLGSFLSNLRSGGSVLYIWTDLQHHPCLEIPSCAPSLEEK